MLDSFLSNDTKSTLKLGFGHARLKILSCEPRYEISNTMVCATSKASDQPAHKRSLFRAFAGHLNNL